jgi:hypothetical protein
LALLLGCVWGDDSTWKIQYLDLSQAEYGIIRRDDRFGYVELLEQMALAEAIDITDRTPDGGDLDVAVAGKRWTRADGRPTRVQGEEWSWPGPPDAARAERFLRELRRQLCIPHSAMDAALRVSALAEVDAALQEQRLTERQAHALKRSINAGRVPVRYGSVGGFIEEAERRLPGEVMAALKYAIAHEFHEDSTVYVGLDGRAGSPYSNVTPASVSAALERLHREVQPRALEQLARERDTSLRAVQDVVLASVQPVVEQAVREGQFAATAAEGMLTQLRDSDQFPEVVLRMLQS